MKVICSWKVLEDISKEKIEIGEAEVENDEVEDRGDPIKELKNITFTNLFNQSLFI